MVTPVRPPRLWLDISTVRGWSGTPHGIARVEAGLAGALADVLPDAHAVWMQGPRLVAGTHDDLLTLTDGSRSTRAGFDVRQTMPGWVDPAVREGVASLGLYGRRARAAWGLTLAATALPEGLGAPIVRGAQALSRREHAQRHEAAPLLDVRIDPRDVLLVTGSDWSGGVVEHVQRIDRDRRPRVWVLVHDLLPTAHPELLCNDTLAARFGVWARAVADVAEHVLLVSEQSRRDFLDFVAQAGLTTPPTSVLAPAVSAGPGGSEPPPGGFLAEPYVVYVSTIERRKNHVVLLQAVRSAVSRGEAIPTVVLVGSWGWGTDDLRQELLRDRELRARVVIFSGLPDVQMRWLVEHATAAVFPSRFEGFGLPAAEARAWGTPVVAADIPALREVLGKDAWFVDPDDSGAWRAALVDVAAGRRPPTASPAGRTWADVAEELLERLPSVLGGPQGGGSTLTPET